MTKRVDIANINELIDSDFYLLDTELIELMKDADQGCLYSQMMLANAFGRGEKAKVDPSLATHYENMIFNNPEAENIHKLSVLWNAAMKEKDVENITTLQDKFHKVIQFMMENMPMEEWDYTLFADMECYIDELNAKILEEN